MCFGKGLLAKFNLFDWEKIYFHQQNVMLLSPEEKNLKSHKEKYSFYKIFNLQNDDQIK